MSEAGLIVMVAESLPVSFGRLVSWSDDRIRTLDQPAYWLIEVSMARDLDEAVEILRGVASENGGTAEQRIAIVVEGWRIDVIPLMETIWKLWRIWQGPDYSYDTVNFPSELIGLLMDWDEFVDSEPIPEELSRATIEWFEKYRNDHHKIFEAVRPFVAMVQVD